MLISVCRIPLIKFSVSIIFFIILFNLFSEKSTEIFGIFSRVSTVLVCLIPALMHLVPRLVEGWSWSWRSFPKLNDCVTLWRAGREGQNSAGAAASPLGVVCVFSRGALLMVAERKTILLYLNAKNQALLQHSPGCRVCQFICTLAGWAAALWWPLWHLLWTEGASSGWFVTHHLCIEETHWECWEISLHFLLQISRALGQIQRFH